MFCQLEKGIQKEKFVHKKSSTNVDFKYAKGMSDNNFIMFPAEKSNLQGIQSTNAFVIQCATTIYCNNYDPQNNLHRNSQIVDVWHKRVGLRQVEKSKAAVFGARGANCNHHASYYRISKAIIINWLRGKTVENAINGINGVIAQLNAVGRGFAPIPRIQFRKSNGLMSKEFDDAIANIANDPRNLFYNENHLGDGRGRLLDLPHIDEEDINQENINQENIMLAYSSVLLNNDMLLEIHNH